MKLLVHVGLHRTASTALQAWLQQMTPALEQAGCFTVCPARAATEGSLFNILVGETFRTMGPEAAAEVVAEELARCETRYSCGILSEENLLGPLPSRKTTAFEAIEPFARALELLGGQHEIVPVIVLRDHLSWLKSLYRVAQFRCETALFSDFAGASLGHGTPFRDVISRLGSTPPIVTSLEAIAADQGRGFLGRLLKALGADGLAGSGRTLSKANASPAPLACEIRQKVARRGGLVIFEGRSDLTRLAGQLSAQPNRRTPEALAQLAELIRCNTVKVPERLGFSKRIAMGQELLKTGPEENLWLSREKAREALQAALRATNAPLVGEPAAAELNNVFAADRQWIATHHPEVTWKPEV